MEWILLYKIVHGDVVGNALVSERMLVHLEHVKQLYGYLHGQHTYNNATEWGCSCAIRPVVTIQFNNSIKKSNEIVYVN